MCLRYENISKIEPNLYLSSITAAQDMNIIRKYQITHILSLGFRPLPSVIIRRNNLRTKFIPILDLATSDILSHLDGAIDFIENGLSNGVVLVHCKVGKSRSAAIVIAYLMKKYNLNFYDALFKVNEIRSIHPNAGFRQQLQLYYKMGCVVNTNDKLYRKFLLSSYYLPDELRKTGRLPSKYVNIIQPDPGLPDCRPEPNCYRCKNCRRILACENHLLLHKIADCDNREYCKKLFFIEPLKWMGLGHSPSGKLYCPKCKCRVGQYSWNSRILCPCNADVKPAFYLIPSKIDHVEFS